MDKEKCSHWSEVFSRWRGSGKSAVSYCRENGIPAWKFYYWKRRLVSAEKKGGFTRLAFSDRPENPCGLWIELSPGIRLVIERHFSSDVLYRVLQTARGRKC